MKLKLTIFMKILVKIEKCLILLIIQLEYYDDSKKLIVGKMKEEIAGVAFKHVLD